MSHYILGVDGGNSKTDYLLCTEAFEYVDILRCNSISHEQYPEGYEATRRELTVHLNKLFERNNITLDDIKSAAFGLAGADFSNQVYNLKQIISDIGFKRFDVANDGILGIKAKSSDGTGICAINGTGTVILGIDKSHNMLQVGGFGTISGDESGGVYILKQAIKKTYSFFFRNGEFADFIPRIVEILEIKDKSYLSQKIADKNFLFERIREIITAVDLFALNGDKFSQHILDNCGRSSANAVIGCINNLNFDKHINIVEAGSLWHKIKYPGLKKVFEQTIKSYTDKRVKFYTLNSPPVVGAVFWAQELNNIFDLTKREQLLLDLSISKYEELCPEN